MVPIQVYRSDSKVKKVGLLVSTRKIVPFCTQELGFCEFASIGSTTASLSNSKRFDRHLDVFRTQSGFGFEYGNDLGMERSGRRGQEGS